jgi:hypothetical protein
MTYCGNLAADVAAGRLTRDELKDLMDDLELAKKKAGLDQVEAKVMARGRVIAEESKLAALIEKRNRLMNIVIEDKLWQQIQEADAMVGNPRLGIEAALVGVNAPISGAQRSVDALTGGIMNSWAGGMIADLKKSNLLSQFNTMKGDFARQVARAIHDLNRAQPEGVDVPQSARQIAEIVHKYQTSAVERQNRAGAYIRHRDGYVVRQSHDPGRMASKGQKAWADAVRNRLDFDAMEIEPDKIDGFLQSAYEAITSGVRLTNQISDIATAFTGPGNLAKKASASRVLLFKSPDDWFDYDQQFGTASLRESIMSDLQSAAKNTALMTNLGTNPQAMFDKVITRAKREWRDDPKKLKSFEKGLFGLQAELDEVTGDVNIGATDTVARWLAGYRALQTMAKLGGAAISAVSDIAYNAANRIYQGRSMMDAWSDAFMAPMKGMSRGDQRIFADMLGTGLEGQLGDFMSRFNAADGAPGRTSKLMAMFFKLNLLGPWSDANKRGATLLIAHDLATNAKKSFDKLPPDLARLLRIYGIDADAWEIARQAVRKGPDGREYIFPGDVPLAERSGDQVRDSLFALLSNEADVSVPSAGGRERAFMRRGYRPGTAAGEAFRFMFQFKSFGVTGLSKVMGRQVYGAGAKSITDQLKRGFGANLGLVNAMVGATVLGYFVMQAKELMKGRSPRENTPATLVAAMMQGGGLGIYGDFLFGEYNRFGGGALETLAGPGVGTVAEVFNLYQKSLGVITGSGDTLAGDVVALAKGNIPFANLFYLKGALDYLLWYQLQETINPGYLKRMERRVKKENNQTYWAPPSSVVATGGGFR